jgi:hypothetical protein
MGIRTLSSAALAAIIVAAPMAPSFATPTDEPFYAIDWSGDVWELDLANQTESLLYSVPELQSTAAADYSPITGKFYTMSPWSGAGEGTLYTVDPATGSFESAQVTGEAPGDFASLGMAISDDGTIFVCLDGVSLYTLDPETASATWVGGMIPENDETEAVVTALSWNSRTDTMYASVDIDVDVMGGLVGGVYEVNLDTGALTSRSPHPFGVGTNGAADFDANGVLWHTDMASKLVYTVELDGAGSFGNPVSQFVLSDDLGGAEAGFFISDPETDGDLAETGFSFAPFAALGVMTLAGGVALAVRRRRA